MSHQFIPRENGASVFHGPSTDEHKLPFLIRFATYTEITKGFMNIARKHYIGRHQVLHSSDELLHNKVGLTLMLKKGFLPSSIEVVYKSRIQNEAPLSLSEAARPLY